MHRFLLHGRSLPPGVAAGGGYGFVSLPRDLAWPLLAGVAIAGAISAIAPANYMHEHLSKGIVSILVLMAAGIPLYIWRRLPCRLPPG